MCGSEECVGEVEAGDWSMTMRGKIRARNDPTTAEPRKERRSSQFKAAKTL